jgi:hypothetical protein
MPPLNRSRPPVPSRPTQFPSGTKAVKTRARVISEFSTPPKGFLNGNNSASEWPVLLACRKIAARLHVTVLYQSKVLGGRKRPGGAVPDIQIPEFRLLIRVQTERYHIAVRSNRHFYDLQQKYALMAVGYRVADIYEEDYMKGGKLIDPSGAGVTKLVWEIMTGFQRGNPVTTRRSRARL